MDSPSVRRVIAADVMEFITDNINLSIKLKVVLIVKAVQECFYWVSET